MSWIISLPCTRTEAEALSGEVPELEMREDAPVIATREMNEEKDEWQADAYVEEKPSDDLINLLQSLIPSAHGAKPVVQQLPDEDWVTLSQQGLKPVQTGRFYVHSSSYAGTAPEGSTAFLIDASQAFGTGGHDTTAGCLSMLDQLGNQVRRPHNIIDIGTGTGLLAFAAHRLWPRAHIMASDIDPASIKVTAENAKINQVPTGSGSGSVALAVATGTNHPAILRRAPYDLVIANILAGPLINLAPDISSITAPSGHVILAGLIARQMDDVLAAYHAHGFRLVARGGSDEWPCLLLMKRHRYGFRRKERAFHRPSESDASFGSW